MAREVTATDSCANMCSVQRRCATKSFFRAVVTASTIETRVMRPVSWKPTVLQKPALAKNDM